MEKISFTGKHQEQDEAPDELDENFTPDLTGFI